MSDTPLVDDLRITEVQEDRPAPGANGRRSTAKRAKPAPTYRKGALVEPLARTYATFAVGLSPFAPQTSVVLMKQAETCAESWDKWAATSPMVRRLLYPLLNISGGAEVLAAHLPIVAAVAIEMKQGTRLAEMAEQYLEMVFAEAASDNADA